MLFVKLNSNSNKMIDYGIHNSWYNELDNESDDNNH